MKWQEGIDRPHLPHLVTSSTDLEHVTFPIKNLDIYDTVYVFEEPYGYCLDKVNGLIKQGQEA